MKIVEHGPLYLVEGVTSLLTYNTCRRYAFSLGVFCVYFVKSPN